MGVSIKSMDLKSLESTSGGLQDPSEPLRSQPHRCEADVVPCPPVQPVSSIPDSTPTLLAQFVMRINAERKQYLGGHPCHQTPQSHRLEQQELDPVSLTAQL